MLSRPWVALAVLVVLGFVVPAAAEEFTPLVKSDDAKALELVGIEPDTLTISGGEIRISGKPNGYFATKESYKNYDLKFEWMYERPSELESDAKFRGNSGLLIHIQMPHEVWPKCVELQLLNAQAGAILPLKGTKCERTLDKEAQKRAIKPVGQWNQQEVSCQGGTIVCKINGIEVSRATGCTIESGPIGWQSEGAPIRLRNVMIKTRD
jgi:Domain of Unknown Function (DUF1080)